MPAVATLTRPHIVDEEVLDLVLSPMFVYTAHYRMELEDIPPDFLLRLRSLPDRGWDIPAWFTKHTVQNLRRAGYSIKYCIK